MSLAEEELVLGKVRISEHHDLGHSVVRGDRLAGQGASRLNDRPDVEWPLEIVPGIVVHFFGMSL